MSKIDEFESLFKSASKPVFHPEPLRLKKILIVVDGESAALGPFLEQVKTFLSVLNSVEHTTEVECLSGGAFGSVAELLDLVKTKQPDLICTFRNLHSLDESYPYSLGEYVDVLTQVTEIPILLIPRPQELSEHGLENTDRVMLMTDHLAGDSRLVTFGALFTQDHGELILAHVEDEQTFDRYVGVISKIPDIDTDSAREEILAQLLKEPHDYVGSCEQVLHEAGLPISIRPIVTVGHHIADYRKLIDENKTDLLILHTKDEDQQAMHGVAYSVSVELRDIPLLLI